MAGFRFAGRGEPLRIQNVMQQKKNFVKMRHGRKYLCPAKVFPPGGGRCAQGPRGPCAQLCRGRLCARMRPETKNAEAPGSFRKGHQRRGEGFRLSSRRSWTGTGLLSPWRGSGRGATWAGGAGLLGWTLLCGGGGCRWWRGGGGSSYQGSLLCTQPVPRTKRPESRIRARTCRSLTKAGCVRIGAPWLPPP